MQLINYLKRIASAEQNVRRNELIEILREMDCSFALYRDKVDNRQPENIVVSFQSGVPRLVIGAHYDSVPGSPGANDNGASVCILLGMIRIYLQHPPNVPIDIVFFDLEENGAAGSKAYLQRFSPKSVLAMINLDVCGVGDTIAIAPRKHVDEGPLSQPILSVEQSDQHRVQIVERLPPGDDVVFEGAGVPNVSVCILPSEEVDAVVEFATGTNQKQSSENRPTITETMHNGPRDSIDVIEEYAMQSVLNWLLSVVESCDSIEKD